MRVRPMHVQGGPRWKLNECSYGKSEQTRSELSPLACCHTAEFLVEFGRNFEEGAFFFVFFLFFQRAQISFFFTANQLVARGAFDEDVSAMGKTRDSCSVETTAKMFWV